MEENDLTKEERREVRRKRRLRNQIVAYITVIALILLMAAGIVLGIGKLTAGRGEAEQESQASQEVLNQILADEEIIQTPEPTPEFVELTPEEKLDQIVDAAIEVMPLEDKVAGLFIVTPEAITGVTTALQAGEGTKEALAQYAVGGLVYFTKNIQSEEQIITMLNNTELYTKYPLFFGVDEEGGSVARLAEAGIGTKVDNAQTIGGSGDTNNAYLAGLSIGGDLSRIGFNLDFAPVADLANVENSAIGTRSYGADAASAAGYVSAAVQGLSEQGITSCLKHFPGIGGSVQDTHTGLASTGRSAEQFRGEEFTVFQAGINAGADMVMIGHISAPELTGNNDPCTFSEELVTNILRNELGFQGVIITDAMNMKAVSDYYDSADAAIQALRAGCDMILMPEDFEAAYNGVLQAVRDGIISEERVNDSLRRIYRIKYADKIEE
ncbi:MAG: beta-N-acetylhexosaminidase [Lachnospiraceae bacterium]|nr:beta-N-acetylhexosaminidase [Lachnospiraceae bacterium]MCI9675904.1 beta-N-acetylhexosaminidase [Lachnospiraceae bacterium]